MLSTLSHNKSSVDIIGVYRTHKISKQKRRAARISTDTKGGFMGIESEHFSFVAEKVHSRNGKKSLDKALIKLFRPFAI
ncbi:hypothetical protein OnM2_045036 [Erysiphe neolycopersici]|uniref:Uncharacterized protein n=1 Tax=Erysiphe neolycopersici TaxID=212602 RepID=A0A420HUI9_9PEZI|nr:hypothetical protein OnM2_045036 [Erysiphe neolycopersici]